MNGQLKVSHAAGARFECGLRAFFEYRDFGTSETTGGRVQAHVVRAVPGSFSGKPHLPQPRPL